MVVARSQWAAEDVANWLTEAARTAHRLPPVRVQGHFNVWPTIVRTHYERLASDDLPTYRFPPSPAEIERMIVVMQWMQRLELEQRQLVWMRAERWRWYDIGKRLGVAPRTAQRRWDIAIRTVAEQLSHEG